MPEKNQHKLQKMQQHKTQPNKKTDYDAIPWFWDEWKALHQGQGSGASVALAMRLKKFTKDLLLSVVPDRTRGLTYESNGLDITINSLIYVCPDTVVRRICFCVYFLIIEGEV